MCCSELKLNFVAISSVNLSFVVPVSAICKGVKNSQSVTSLNFTGCELGPAGTEILAKVVKVRTVKR